MCVVCSLREAMSGEDRDATLTHIIHELRDYKKRLVEQIDASRARGTADQGPTTTSSSTGQPSTPPAAVCLAPTPHRPAVSPATNGQLAAAAKPAPWPRKELPDLVRSSIPPVVGTTKPAGAGRPAAIWNPALSVSYSVDSFGALDLSTTRSRPATITSHDYPPPPPAAASDMVLDLSCGRHRPSFSPPLMTSSIRPEAESASRSRRHNRKSSGSMATGRHHDDHDNPLRWSVRDVIEFVSEVPGCQAYAEVHVLAYLLSLLANFVFIGVFIVAKSSPYERVFCCRVVRVGLRALLVGLGHLRYQTRSVPNNFGTKKDVFGTT